MSLPKVSWASIKAQPDSAVSWIVALLWVVVLGYAIYVALAIADGYRSASQGGMPLYTDFTPRYGASLLLQTGPAEQVFVPQAMMQASGEAARRMYGDITAAQAAGVGYSAWMYPPTFFFAVEPLAYMPYWLAWLAWLLVTGIPYLMAMRRILPERIAWPFALAAPPVFFNLMYGQTGFLVGGLIGLGLVALANRPALAGVLLGLASVKPHFGVLIPLALLAGGQWKVFGTALATVCTMIAASVLVYGDIPWFAYIGTSMSYTAGFDFGAFSYFPMLTVLSAMKLAGFSSDTAWAVQYLSAALMAILVCWVWWKGRGRPDTLGLRCAILCLATLLSVPMAYLYDAVLVMPAAAWLLSDMLQTRAKRWKKVLLVMTLTAFLAVMPLAMASSVQIGPLLIAMLLAMCLQHFIEAIRISQPFSVAS